MFLQSGSVHLRLLVSGCFRRFQYEHYRFRSRVSSPTGVNRKGRFPLMKQKVAHQNDQQQTNFLDEEQYYDRDFDYVDHQQLKLQRQLNEKYLQHGGDDSPKSILTRKYRNALYEDDEDDLKLANTKRDIGRNSKQLVSKLHRQFDKERRIQMSPRVNENENIQDMNISNEKLLSQSDHEYNRVLKKKNLRTLVPLPYAITAENRFDILNQIVIPYYKTPYHFQLKRKLQQNMEILRRFGNKLHEMDGPVRINRGGLPCPLEPVRASPLIEQYRNKDEFSVWPGIDGISKTVGFFVGQPSVHDRVICVEPDQVVITKKSHIDIAAKFQRYLREVSLYDSCQNYGEAGNWRRIHIRSNQQNQHMVTTIMHPQELTEDQLQQEMNQLRAYFADDSRVHSLYFHTSRHTRSTHTDAKYYHLAGSSAISEQLFNKHFAISPSSFFQVYALSPIFKYRAYSGYVHPSRDSRPAFTAPFVT